MTGTPTAMSVLCWPKRLLSADDLRRHLTSQREVVLQPNTVITPLAADELRAKGVRISWENPKPAQESASKRLGWFFAKEKDDAMIAAALQALDRDGIKVFMLEGSPRTIAETLVQSSCIGGMIFLSDPATACCIANKVGGVRAAVVASVAQVVCAKTNLGANLFVIETPGRTFFELRQMLKTIVTGEVRCPDEVAKVLKELDGHAHR
jgi:hypothetical protein